MPRNEKLTQRGRRRRPGHRPARRLRPVREQAEAVAELVRGQTTRQGVLQLLGPPSQVIALDDETVLYYLFERSEGEGIVLVVYNRMQIDTRYDRAILFFDQNDLLSDFATRIQAEE